MPGNRKTGGPGPSAPGHKSSRLIFLRGTTLGRACRVFVDCGCSDLAMSSSFAARLGIEVESLCSEPVTLANGSQQLVSRTVQAVPFSVGSEYTEDLHFTVTDLTYDIILGLPWLESGNKHVDWKTRTISFIHEARPVTLSAGRPFKRASHSAF
jgi:hypothetical protein